MRCVSICVFLRCYTDNQCRGAVYVASMPKPKKPSHKLLVGKLLASNRLSPAEHIAFKQMETSLRAGQELTEHQKLWIETLRHKTEA